MPATTDAAQPTTSPSRSDTRWRPGLPMLLSLVVPGLGQFYDGRRFAGAVWLLSTLVGYIPFILPGAILHLLAIGTAGFRKTSSGD
ncbi:hypothetical protein K2D_38380 [Planctomycetes bacterium K2D]|uniref:TM2 domain protein n=2 Tax=Botrimarina mediterranea TaxID=2528022 RepID=A0A518KCT6_9BACT|nr:hypothetical protein Spa11_37980 [Botrimarina mediterranea]QDV80213.1 hypothetical protein K2D_38380 [Planctomycetes bacterium K2D]